jgi:hypothetical protein
LNLALLLLLLLALQAESCLNRTRAGEATCQKAPYCFWHPENKVCMRNTLEFAADFDKQVERLYVSNFLLMVFFAGGPNSCMHGCISTALFTIGWSMTCTCAGACSIRYDALFGMRDCRTFVYVLVHMEPAAFQFVLLQQVHALTAPAVIASALAVDVL